MNGFRVLAIVATTCLLIGCDDQLQNQATDQLQDSTAIKSSIAEAQTNAELTVELDRTELDLTQQLTVSVQTRWQDGVSVELIVPDWDETKWTQNTSTAGPIEFDGSRFTQQFEFTLEPFLSGPYTVPSFGIRSESQTAGKRIARLQPIDVAVVSVLDETDNGELEPAYGFSALPQTEQDSNRSLGIWIGLGVTMLSCGYIVLLNAQRKEELEEQIDPHAMLAVVAKADHLNDEDLGGFHRALVQLSIHHTTVTPIAEEIERMRFSGNAVDYQNIRTAAIRAKQICEAGS